MEEPTLSPVYEPGPALTQTASQSAMAMPRASSISLTKGAVREACALGRVLSLYSAMLPSIARAVEQSEVDVSISTILAISLYLYVGGEALEGGEYRLGHLPQRGIYLRVVEHAAFDQVDG